MLHSYNHLHTDTKEASNNLFRRSLLHSCVIAGSKWLSTQSLLHSVTNCDWRMAAISVFKNDCLSRKPKVSVAFKASLRKGGHAKFSRVKVVVINV